MTRVLFISIILCIGMFFFGGDIVISSEGEHIATIESFEGTIEILRKDQKFPKKAKENDHMFEGDIIIMLPPSEVCLSHTTVKEIHVKKDISTSLSQKDKQIEAKLPENNKLWIYLRKEAHEIKTVPHLSSSSSNFKNFFEDALNSMRYALFPQSNKYSQAGGAREEHLRQTKIVDLVTPVGARVIKRKPDFVWLPLKGVNKYEFILFDGTGSVIWRKVIGQELDKKDKESRVKYEYHKDKEAPVLNVGEYYFWHVNELSSIRQSSGRRKNLYLASGIAYFIIMPEHKSREVYQTIKEVEEQFLEMASYETLTLYLGAYYEQQHLYVKAQEKYEELLQLQPQNENYIKMLANLYIKVGRKWKAASLQKIQDSSENSMNENRY